MNYERVWYNSRRSAERLREWAVRWGSPGGGAGRAGAAGYGGSGGAGPVGASAVVPRVWGTGGADTGGAIGGTGVGGASRQESLSPEQLCAWAVYWAVPMVELVQSALRHLLSLPPATTEFPVVGTTPPLLFPPTDKSQPQLLPGSPLHAPTPHTEVTESLTERPEHETRASTPVCSRHVVRPRATAVPGTHRMAFRPSTVPQRVVLPSPPASSLPHVPDPESDLVCTASPTLSRLLATVLTDPSFESAAASALVAELVDFAALCPLYYAASLVFYSSCPPSIGGELALGCDVLEDMQFEQECLATAAPHLASTLLCPEGDPDALDIPTPRTYAEAITVKRPPGSPPAFKARYVARGFSQHEGVDFFQTFSPIPKMTTIRVLLHVAAQRDYELHSLDFSTAFVQGSLHEAIWTTFAALGLAPSTADPSLFLRTDTSLSLFYVLVYVDDLVFAIAGNEALALVKAELQERHTCTDLGPSAL
ncbi:unnamed protein product [Closterium sp. NIES-53]